MPTPPSAQPAADGRSSPRPEKKTEVRKSLKLKPIQRPPQANVQAGKSTLATTTKEAAKAAASMARARARTSLFSPRSGRATTDKKTLRMVFDKFDLDGSGSVGQAEISKMMRMFKINLPERKLANIIAEVDDEGNNQIEFEEFFLLLTKLQETMVVKLTLFGTRSSSCTCTCCSRWPITLLALPLHRPRDEFCKLAAVPDGAVHFLRDRLPEPGGHAAIEGGGVHGPKCDAHVCHAAVRRAAQDGACS